MIRAGQTGAECLFFLDTVFVHNDLNQPFPMGYSQFTRLRKTALHTIFHLDPVYNDLYGMFESLFQLDLIFFQKVDLPINTDTRKSFFADTF